MTPADRERRLLDAACATGERAAGAWERWSRDADFDRLEPGEYQLLPAVFRNLESQAPAGTAFRKAMAIYRQTWVANQVLLREAAERCRGLEDKGMAYALAGDAALAVLAYPDPGARPIASVAVLQANEATSRFERSLLDAAVPGRAGDAMVRVMAPAHLLFRSCERISAWDPEPMAPALADAWKLLGRMTAQDWARLLEFARGERVALTLGRGLEQLERVGAGPLPENVFRELAAARPGWVERLEYRIKSRPLWTVPGRTLSLRALRYLRR